MIDIAEIRKVLKGYNLEFSAMSIISNRTDAKYGKSQKDLGDGWLLITHSNNQMKKQFLDKVSDVLHLGLKVTLNS